MNRYVIKFSKEGYIKYTSHLDMLRLFKRAFKKAGIKLAYSQGYNPHPKMGFAQPLSLGYTSICEILEFETQIVYECDDLKNRLSDMMPEGIKILSLSELSSEVKSLAALVTEATYEVSFPVANDIEKYRDILNGYLAQDQILAMKRQKKTKKMKEIDIKSKIRSIEPEEGEKLVLKMTLDCGSASNLSPEQVIASFISYSGLDIQRHDVDVERTEMVFDKNLQF